MKFKKAVSLVLVCSLMVSPLTTSAHIKNNVTVSKDQNENSKAQQISSDAEIETLRSNVKQLEKEIIKLKEEKTNSELSQVRQMLKEQKSSTPWVSTVIKLGADITVFSIVLAGLFEKTSKKNDCFPDLLEPFRYYGDRILNWFEVATLGLVTATGLKETRINR